jgi:hypothetical protein
MPGLLVLRVLLHSYDLGNLTTIVVYFHALLGPCLIYPLIKNVKIVDTSVIPVGFKPSLGVFLHLSPDESRAAS